MALWPNNFSNLRGFSSIGLFGDAGLGMSQQLTQRQLSFFVNNVVSPTASIPEGSFESRACILAPLVGGAISAGNSTANPAITAAAALIAGAPISGAATLTLAESGASLSLVIALSGEATLTLTTADAVLSLTIGLTGEATWMLTPTAGLSMTVPVAGSGVLSVSGTADLKGLLAMSGESSSFTELSPESLARAVWSAVATANDEPGTMGAKLNDAGGASNPWTEVIESGYTAAEILRLLASVMAGKSSGGGGATVTFRDAADSKNRITATVDANGNRTAITLDATP